MEKATKKFRTISDLLNAKTDKIKTQINVKNGAGLVAKECIRFTDDELSSIYSLLRRHSVESVRAMLWRIARKENLKRNDKFMYENQ